MPDLIVTWRAALISLLFLVAGCSTPSIVGNWKSSFGSVEIDVSFDNAGHVTGKGDLAGNKVVASGSYKLEDDNLTIHFEKVESPNPMIQLMAGRNPGLIESGRLEWKNDHQFIVSSAGRPPVAFERI